MNFSHKLVNLKTLIIMPEIISEIKRSTFLTRFILIISLTNLIGFCWAINPSAVGTYVILFFLFPINLLIMLIGLGRVLILNRQQKGINTLLYFILVVALPVVFAFILCLLIPMFAKKGGC